MRSRQDTHSGQVLVQVALMMVVLLGFLALAVDVSQVYLKRRQLQNAADAGALEGARHICFVPGATTASALSAAQDAARANAPASSPPLATRDDWSVTVVVTQQIPSFVASIVGQDVFNPGARATAVCGAADRGVGDLWPLTVHINEFNDIDCGDAFTVFTDQNYLQGIDCVTDCDCENMVIETNDFTGQPSKTYIPDPNFVAELLANGITHRIAPGQRGWMNLFDPPDPFPDPTCNFQNCGGALACWVEQPHPGPVSVCDQIKTESGSVWSDGIRDGIRTQADLAYSQNETLNIPLWGATCTPAGPILGSNCGYTALYTVRDFGCIKVLGYTTELRIPEQDDFDRSCRKNMKVIFARRVCPCNSFQGGTGGGDPISEVRAVSLIE